ncbi:hypothetical protein HDU96_009228 [Phlyctochytrium bullatum]|nr:hypothetical protein HDU96_009228 [Phlyctochytrium bullatum]
MHLSTLLGALYVAAGTIAAKLPHGGLVFQDLDREDPVKVRPSLEWTNCSVKPEVPLYCAELLVPLNHANASDTRKIGIALIKYPTNSTDKLGSILMNPGGPGGSGFSFVKAAGPEYARLSGGKYDIIGFDPRGVGKSSPVYCFSSGPEAASFQATHSSAYFPRTPDLHVSTAEFAAWKLTLASSCVRYAGDILPYISSSQTARDIDLIREALGESVTNFWGFSYGTFLGMTYVNMFPDRVGRVVLDGNVDAKAYVGSILDYSLKRMIDTDKVLEAFATGCELAGPTHCALAPLLAKSTPGGPSTVMDIIQTFLYKLVSHPLPAPDAVLPIVLTRSDVIGTFFSALYRPKTWPTLATAVAAALAGPQANATALANVVLTGDPNGRNTSEVELVCPLDRSEGSGAYDAVYCADKKDQASVPLETWDAWAERAAEVSWVYGRHNVYNGVVCKYWPRPVERYDGPWNRTLKNRILFVGNTLDPVTSRVNAFSNAEYLGPKNAYVQVHDGAGHCSGAQPSLCTINVVRTYFDEGKLPTGEGKTCKADVPVFFPPPPKPSAASFLREEEYVVAMRDWQALEDARKGEEAMHGAVKDVKRLG